MEKKIRKKLKFLCDKIKTNKGKNLKFEKSIKENSFEDISNFAWLLL